MSETQGQNVALKEPRNEPRTIGDLMKHPGTMSRFKQIMPRHLSAERMLRVCSMAINTTPALAKCEPITLLGAMLACASFGLEPNTPLGHAYLIPFKKRKKEGSNWVDVYQVQLIIGYRGFIDLARRSGNMISIHADVVYEGDEFSFEYGTNQHLRHVPKGERGGRKKLWSYAHAKLTDGEAFEVLPYAQVMAIRDGSQGYQAALKSKEEAEANKADEWKMKSYLSSPWVAHEHEMSSKTLIRRVSKYLPMSLEFATAVAVDDAADRGTLDLTAISANPAGLTDGSIVETEDPEVVNPEAQITEPERATKTQTGTEQVGDNMSTDSGAAVGRSEAESTRRSPASDQTQKKPKEDGLDLPTNLDRRPKDTEAKAEAKPAAKKPAAKPKALFDTGG